MLAPVCTSSEAWSGWVEITKNEIVHAATYSEIVRNSFDNPDDILNQEDVHNRLMRKYKDAPMWWYLATCVSMTAIGIFVVE